MCTWYGIIGLGYCKWHCFVINLRKLFLELMDIGGSELLVKKGDNQSTVLHYMICNNIICPPVDVISWHSENKSWKNIVK